MRPRDRALAQRLEAGLLTFSRENRPLPGIRSSANRMALIEQLLESIHRVEYVPLIATRDVSERRADPNDELFDPLKAAILHQRRGNIEEAFWLVFIFVHFGKHAAAGWRYAREIYGRLGERSRWDWVSTSADPAGFREWLHNHQNELKREGVPRGFGNHRKYESLDAYTPKGTGAVVESYVRWVNPPRTHVELIQEVTRSAVGNPREAFDLLYNSMESITRFGRTARFDYLTMIGKLGLAPIEPGSTYMQNSTGPIDGARLLFGMAKTAPLKAAELDKWLVELGAELNVGMQVLEDSLCNWQKSPGRFRRFRG